MLVSSVSERSLGGLSSDSGGLSIVQQNKNSSLAIFCLFLSLCDTHKHECKYAHLFDSYVYIVTDSLIRMSTQMRQHKESKWKFLQYCDVTVDELTS